MPIGKRGATSAEDVASYRRLCDDLAAEETALDVVVAPLDEPSWSRPTPAVGWTVRDQISHLAASEELAGLAASAPDAFAAELERMMTDLEHADSDHLAKGRAMAPGELLAWWRTARAATVDGLRRHDPRDRLPWAVGEMSARSFATARLMETWAHGQDVIDALGLAPIASARLRHVAELGIRTCAFSYDNRGLAPPTSEVRVELSAPNGEEWAWGPFAAVNQVVGPALDFCLVVTQRRPVSRTSLRVTGGAAEEWMSIAQVFAGPPTAPAANGDQVASAQEPG